MLVIQVRGMSKFDLFLLLMVIGSITGLGMAYYQEKLVKLQDEYLSKGEAPPVRVLVKTALAFIVCGAIMFVSFFKVVLLFHPIT